MLDYFANDKYKVLECMFQRQIAVNGENVVKLSQQEIADILSFTKPKVNSIIADLKKDGYQVVSVSTLAKAHGCTLRNGSEYIRARKQ